MPYKKILVLRKKIDIIDQKILKLLAERFNVTSKIQRVKRKLALPLLQKSREKSQMISYMRVAKRLKLNPQLIRKIFSAIFSYAKKPDIIK